MHFTGKERDTESDLDDFGARYYSSTFGRWMSADYSDVLVAVPYADLTNPQSLNLYALVRNNPETFSDLDGHYLSITQAEEEGVGQVGGTGNSSNPAGQTTSTSATPVSAAGVPTRDDITKELNRLADAYGVPQPLVLAVAETESNFDTNAVTVNKDKAGNPTSTDYGVMQVNSTNINHEAKGPDGKSFTIPDSIKTDWKANANAGVAILAQDYKAAAKDQPHGTDQTKAQQAYSAYNAGPGDKNRYQRPGTNGGFEDRRDQNFLINYKAQSGGTN
jgi:RHS repeat-associated protein